MMTLVNDGNYDKIVFDFKAIDDAEIQIKVKSIIDGLPTILKNDLFQTIRESISHELDKFSKENTLIEWAQILDWPTVNIDFIPW